MKNYDGQSIEECVEQFNETFTNTAEIHEPSFGDWVTTNKTDKGEESLVYRVIEPGTGREIAQDLEEDEAIIIENSRELYDAVADLFNGDLEIGDAINELQYIFERIY